MNELETTANDSVSARLMGNVSVGGSAYYPWPQPWNPNPYRPYVYPTTTIIQSPPVEDYANEVEVERGEHDAVLRFYRSRGKSKTLVKEITVPVGILDWFQAP